MTNREQFEMLENYVQQNHPDEYEGILLTREQLKNQNL